MSNPTPRLDQIADLTFYAGVPKSMNLSDPGTGKTISVCMNHRRRIEDGIKTVWVQPLSLIEKNIEEAMIWGKFKRDEIGVIDGSPAKIQREFLKDPAIILMGPDRLKSVYTDLPDRGFQAMDTDEMHMCFGGATSQRTLAFLELSRFMKEMVHMTGTIINGRLDTAYPAIQSIDPRYYPLGYDHFLGEHAYLDDRGKPTQWIGHDKIATILGRHGIRRSFESIFGKQPVVQQVQWVAMHPAQRKMFDTLRDDALLELEHFFVDGGQPGPAMIRARQLQELPNVFPDLRDPDGKLKLPPIDLMPGVRPPKEEALRIHLEDHLRKGTPLIIFAYFVKQQKQIQKLCHEMGMSCGLINGDMSREQKSEASLAFREGRYQVICSSQQPGSVGHNWQFWGPKRIEVDHVINVSLGFLPNDFTQGYKRAIRGVRERPLRVTTMAYYDSIDFRLMQILERKSMDAHLVQPDQEVLRFNHYQRMDEMTVH